MPPSLWSSTARTAPALRGNTASSFPLASSSWLPAHPPSRQNCAAGEEHYAEFPQGAVIFIKAMEPHLGWTHELQLHEMGLLVVCPIMDLPQLVDLIEPAIHIRVPTLRIELNKFGPCPPFAVPLPDIGTTSPPMAPSRTAHARTSIFRLPCRRTPTTRRVFLPYSSTPCMMEASCFSITLWMACTIPGLRNRGLKVESSGVLVLAGSTSMRDSPSVLPPQNARN